MMQSVVFKFLGFRFLLWWASVRFAPWYRALADFQMVWGKGLRVVRHQLALHNFPDNAPPLRVAFLSDLHYGSTVGQLAPLRAWRSVRAARPDVLLLGGDYLYGYEKRLPELRRALEAWRDAPPPAGIYACLGNHDYLRDTGAIVQTLQSCGVRILVNEAVELPEPWRGVWIAGVDDTDMGDPRPHKTLANVPLSACTILLAHAPDIYGIFPDNDCALTLCGDTHGGQICTPRGRPVMMASYWGRRFCAGLYRVNANWLYVSRGVGTVSLPFRLWAPPDVAILDLHR